MNNINTKGTRPRSSSTNEKGTPPQNSSSSTQRKRSNHEKLKIDSYDSSPGPLGFLFMCLMFVFKRFVFAPTHVKIGVYMMFLVSCSVVHDFNLIGSTNFFAQKENFLNKVRLGNKS